MQQESDRYDFSRADRIADFARTRDLTLRGHCLCWHINGTSWLRKLTKLELEKVLRDYILTTVDRYKGICTAWDVVNEAIDDKGKIRKSIWSQIENFIPKCFQWAREADRHSTPYTFDADFQPKPAYFALENTLQRYASTVLQS